MFRSSWPREIVRLESEEVEVVPDAHRAEADVDVGEADPEETQPRPHHVAVIEAADARCSSSRRRAPSTSSRGSRRPDGGGMAAEGVAGQQDDVDDQDERADGDAEMLRAVRGLEPERVPRIAAEDEDEDEREVEEVAVDVLQDERQVALARVALARLADGAIRPGRARTPYNKRRDNNNR